MLDESTIANKMYWVINLKKFTINIQANNLEKELDRLTDAVYVGLELEEKDFFEMYPFNFY